MIPLREGNFDSSVSPPRRGKIRTLTGSFTKSPPLPGVPPQGMADDRCISEVTIQIWVMIWKGREPATRRGSSLPLKVPSNATFEALKVKAVAKQNRFNSSLIKDDKALGY